MNTNEGGLPFFFDDPTLRDVADEGAPMDTFSVAMFGAPRPPHSRTRADFITGLCHLYKARFSTQLGPKVIHLLGEEHVTRRFCPRSSAFKTPIEYLYDLRYEEGLARISVVAELTPHNEEADTSAPMTAFGVGAELQKDWLQVDPAEIRTVLDVENMSVPTLFHVLGFTEEENEAEEEDVPPSILRLPQKILIIFLFIRELTVPVFLQYLEEYFDLLFDDSDAFETCNLVQRAGRIHVELLDVDGMRKAIRALRLRERMALKRHFMLRLRRYIGELRSSWEPEFLQEYEAEARTDGWPVAFQDDDPPDVRLVKTMFSVEYHDRTLSELGDVAFEASLCAFALLRLRDTNTVAVYAGASHNPNVYDFFKSYMGTTGLLLLGSRPLETERELTDETSFVLDPMQAATLTTRSQESSPACLPTQLYVQTEMRSCV